MLAELFMLRLETAFRNVAAPPCSIGDKRFVPYQVAYQPQLQPAPIVERETSIGQQKAL
jgi:hypothetical protein